MILLLLLLLPGLAWGATLACPIGATQRPDGDWERAATLQTETALTSALTTALGLAPTATPWEDEIEVSSARTAANLLRISLPGWDTLTARLRQEVLDTGCAVVAADFGQPARPPRRSPDNTQLLYDADDATRPILQPTRHGLPANRRTSRPWWRVVLQRLGPALAWALGDAPVTPVRERCDRGDEDPMTQSGAWDTADVDGDPSPHALACSSGQILRGDAGGSMRSATWGTAFPGDQEAYLTLAVLSGETQLLLGLGATQTANWTGYLLQYNNALTRLIVFRRDAGSSVQLGTIVSSSPGLAANDRLHVRRLGSTLYACWTASAVQQACVARGPDSTYSGPGKIGVGNDNLAWRGDNLGGGALGGVSPATHLLRRR